MVSAGGSRSEFLGRRPLGLGVGSMLLGPLFRTEAVLLARRPRTFATRCAIGLALLLVIGNRYLDSKDRGGAVALSARGTAAFARSTVDWLLVIQAACVVMLVPTLVSGIIAEERQARTLPDLLTTRLSGFEIVVGKLAARLLVVFTWLAIGAPILALLGLFGGVDPESVLLAEATTASTAIALGSLTALVSTRSRRPRDVLLIVYAIALTWLVVSAIGVSVPIAAGFVGRSAPWLNWAWRTSPSWVVTPFALALASFGRRAIVLSPTAVGEMMLAQGAASVLMLSIAVWRLRPISRRLDSGPNRRIGRATRRPPVGDDAMLWKERYAMGVARLGKFILLPVAFIVLAAWYFGIFGYYSFPYRNLGWHYDAALREFLRHGYHRGPDANFVWARHHFNGYLTAFSSLFLVPWLISVAAVSASGVTTERERGTWVGLLASPLSAVEIVRAKLVGPTWGLKPFLAFILFPWLIGLVMGATHPIGVLAAVVSLGVLTWFASALGTYVSIRSKTTTSAMSRAIAILLAVDLFAIILVGPLITPGRAAWILYQPSAMADMPISTYQFARLSAESPIEPFRLTSQQFIEKAIAPGFGYVQVVVVSANVLLHLIAAAVLSLGSIHALNVEADRPRIRRPRGSSPP